MNTRSLKCERYRRMGEKNRREQFYRQAPEDRLGDAPIEAAYHEKMVRVAQALDELFNGDKTGDDREIGFLLLVYPFGDREGRCNYISNGADRRDVVTLFREMIARFKGQPDVSGSA